MASATKTQSQLLGRSRFPQQPFRLTIRFVRFAEGAAPAQEIRLPAKDDSLADVVADIPLDPEGAIPVLERSLGLPALRVKLTEIAEAEALGTTRAGSAIPSQSLLVKLACLLVSTGFVVEQGEVVEDRRFQPAVSHPADKLEYLPL